MDIGYIDALYRYPVKSMRGDALDAAELGWHGLEGDRRFAVHRVGDHTAFPWLTAGRLPELLLFTPVRHEDGDGPPTHIRTPDGDNLPIFSDALAAEIARRHGAPVEMVQFRQGFFDDATISVIAADTVHAIGRLAGAGDDVRRFRPNIVVRLREPAAFAEDAWVGGTLQFGEGDEGAAITVAMPDVRCSMVNLDPDTAASSPEVLKAIVRANATNAGIYGSVARAGRLRVGQPVRLTARASPL